LKQALAFSFAFFSVIVVAARQEQATPSSDPSIPAFLQAVETAIAATSRSAWLELLSQNADRNAAAEFFDAMVPSGVTRAVVRERDRSPLAGSLPGDGFGLIADVLTETGARGRITTWRIDIRRPRDATDRQPWRVIGQEKLAVVDGLHMLSLHAGKQFAARDFVIKSVDFELRLPTGDVFVAETAEGVTALVLLGDGVMTFAPAPPEERGQVRIFAGTDTIDTPFTAAYVRLNPFEFEQHLKRQLQNPVAPDSRALRRAQTIFDEEVRKSFSLDLHDLSRENWSLLPQAGDFLAEVRTRRFDTLTFARSTGEAEDISLFHRDRKRNISAYASEMKLSSRGRFFNEDDLVEYDVLDYNIDATYAPEREWLDGRTRLKIRIKAYAIAALTLRLAEDFNVQSIASDELGRLMFLRVRNQNAVVVNLPSPVARDLELTLNVTYSGRIRAQSLDQESLEMQSPARGPQRSEDLPYIPPEPKWLFSNRSHWYPQGQVSDYATSTIRFTVPAEYAVVASGVQALESPARSGPTSTQPARATYVFTAAQPLRYLGVVVSKFIRVDATTVALDIVPPSSSPERTQRLKVPAIGSRNTIQLIVEANKRQQDRGREIVDTSAEILRFYAATVGDVPYDAMTIAMVEHDTPGGHSPGYVAMLNNPPPVTPFVFRNDPAVFTGFPEFYVAHELAHQWWGQAVGWKNYHEQWLSEGLAQYFAALYAKERRGEQAFRDVLRQFRRWAMGQSDQGAIYLGYRLGHLKGDSRVFRALVYNKGALVLHMLRRLLGDEPFFRGLKRYYAENRFRKAGTEDLQRAMEAESGRPLARFFERWIFGSGLPRLRYSIAVEGQDLVVRFEQIGEVYDVPVTVAIPYADNVAEEVVAVTESVVEKRFPIANKAGVSIGALRDVVINADHAALGTFERR
jgi:hypothetical protein